MFTVEDRDRLRDWVVGMASSDRRVVAGAVLGSLAHDEGDRWSDLDLTFAVVRNDLGEMVGAVCVGKDPEHNH